VHARRHAKITSTNAPDTTKSHRVSSPRHRCHRNAMSPLAEVCQNMAFPSPLASSDHALMRAADQAIVDVLEIWTTSHDAPQGPPASPVAPFDYSFIGKPRDPTALPGWSPDMLVEALLASDVGEVPELFASPLDCSPRDASDQADPADDDMRTPMSCDHLQRRLFSPLDMADNQDCKCLYSDRRIPNLLRPQSMEALFEHQECADASAEMPPKLMESSQAKEAGIEEVHASLLPSDLFMCSESDTVEFNCEGSRQTDLDEHRNQCSDCGCDHDECSSAVSSVDYQKFDSISDVRAALESHILCWPAPTALDLEDHLSRAPDVRIFWFLDVRDRMYNAAMAEDWEQSSTALEPIQEYPPGWPQWRIDSFELRQACRANREAAAAAAASGGTKRRSRSAHAMLG